MAKSGKTLHDLAHQITIYPQVLINVKGVDRARVDDDVVQAAVREAETELGETGRVLLRASGTEPVIRVMVEAAEMGQAQGWADRIARIVTKQLAI